MSDDLRERLEEDRKSKEWAETWKPSEPGDMLVGTLEGYDEAETDFGTYEVAHIRNENGVLKGLWLMHSVLREQWNDANPDVGDRVGALYHGKRSGENFDYHMWTVEVERTDEPPEDRPPMSNADESSPLDGQEQAERLYADEEAENRPDSSLNDPNGPLPY